MTPDDGQQEQHGADEDEQAQSEQERPVGLGFRAEPGLLPIKVVVDPLRGRGAARRRPWRGDQGLVAPTEKRPARPFPLRSVVGHRSQPPTRLRGDKLASPQAIDTIVANS